MLAGKTALWKKAYGSAQDQSAQGLASNGKDKLFVTGFFQGQKVGGTHAFVARVDPEGP